MTVMEDRTGETTALLILEIRAFTTRHHSEVVEEVVTTIAEDLMEVVANVAVKEAAAEVVN
jgi:uncharacterized protein (DUF302 family)